MTDTQRLWSASAPGKVLICGGYLIVEPGNEGLSIGVSARFTTKVTRTEVVESAAGSITVIVNSPQFGKTFKFHVSAKESGESGVKSSVIVTQSEGPNSPFLHNAVLYSFAHLCCPGLGEGMSAVNKQVARDLLVGRLWELDLLADNPFYSQRNYLAEKNLPVTVENLREHVPQHQPLVGEVSKTGLGSSAALTTSLVACLHYQYGLGNTAATTTAATTQKESIHRISQIAHSIAQGKVGSGFDVYTAVFGTSIYSRFNPVVVVDLMRSHKKEGDDAESEEFHGDSNTVFTDLLYRVVGEPAAVKQSLKDAGADDSVVPLADDSMWVRPRAFAGLPRGCALLLADVHQGGSQTPGMVSSIMKWKASVTGKSAAEGNLWLRQKELNKQYLKAMESLSVQSRLAEHKKSWEQAVTVLAQKVGSEWDKATVVEGGAETTKFVQALAQLRQYAQLARENLKEIGRLSDVEVEPEVLTPLLNSTTTIPGVLAAGCPGAGGYDALFAIVLDPTTFGAQSEKATTAEGNCAAVEKYWESCTDLSVCPLVVREDPAGGLTADSSSIPL